MSRKSVSIYNQSKIAKQFNDKLINQKYQLLTFDKRLGKACTEEMMFRLKPES